jgi:hypothetical protein
MSSVIATPKISSLRVSRRVFENMVFVAYNASSTRSRQAGRGLFGAIGDSERPAFMQKH